MHSRAIGFVRSISRPDRQPAHSGHFRAPAIGRRANTFPRWLRFAKIVGRRNPFGDNEFHREIDPRKSLLSTPRRQTFPLTSRRLTGKRRFGTRSTLRPSADCGQCPDSCVICVISVRRFEVRPLAQGPGNARILASFASFASWKSNKAPSMDAPRCRPRLLRRPGNPDCRPVVVNRHDRPDRSIHCSERRGGFVRAISGRRPRRRSRRGSRIPRIRHSRSVACATRGLGFVSKKSRRGVLSVWASRRRSPSGPINMAWAMREFLRHLRVRWPRSRFSARGTGWPACPIRARNVDS
jgi:hypothetical protein